MNVTSCIRGEFAFSGSLRLAKAALRATLLVFALWHAEPALAEIPPSAEKKTVSLDSSRVEEEHVFAVTCAKCHASPDPASPASEKPDCRKGLSEGDRTRVQAYIADVVKGKGLYESRCGRCHALISPGSHTREYWSNNLCTSGECFIENLKKEEEQQVLLYLTSQAKKK
jgi:cytochrome c5